MVGKWNNDLAHNLAMMLVFHLAEILAILWYFNLSLNHDQQFAMDVILDQFLAFDFAILVFSYCRDPAVLSYFELS